jgi:hypothetical protein
MKSPDVILAATENFWFTVFIFIVWGISSYLDFKKKQKKKFAKRGKPKKDRPSKTAYNKSDWAQMKSSQSPKQEPKTSKVDEIDTAFEEDLAGYYGIEEAEDLNKLKTAEEKAQNAPYKTISLGGDLQVRLQDLLPPELQDALKPPEPVVEEVEIPKETEHHDISQDQFSEPHRHFKDEEKVEVKTQNLNAYFPGGVRSAIIASEILGKPKALRNKKL